MNRYFNLKYSQRSKKSQNETIRTRFACYKLLINEYEKVKGNLKLIFKSNKLRD